MIDTDDIDQAKLERILNGSSIQRRSSTEQATHHIGYTRVISTYTRTTWIYFLDEEIDHKIYSESTQITRKRTERPSACTCHCKKI